MKNVKKEIEYISNLARLEFQDKEIEDIIERLSVMIDNASILEEIHIENVEDTFNINQYHDSIREDIIGESIETDKVFLNTKHHEKGYFQVSL